MTHEEISEAARNLLAGFNETELAEMLAAAQTELAKPTRCPYCPHCLPPDLFTGPQWETRDPEAEERERDIQRHA